jgi:uncharacterized protein
MFQKINFKNARYCNFSHSKCYDFISVYPEKLFGPCDCFSANDFEIKVDNSITFEGNIKNTLLNEQLKFLEVLMDECYSCDIYEFCTGGCLSQRYNFRNNKKLAQEYCESRKMLYSYANGYIIT